MTEELTEQQREVNALWENESTTIDDWRDFLHKYPNVHLRNRMFQLRIRADEEFGGNITTAILYDICTNLEEHNRYMRGVFSQPPSKDEPWK